MYYEHQLIEYLSLALSFSFYKCRNGEDGCGVCGVFSSNIRKPNVRNRHRLQSHGVDCSVHYICSVILPLSCLTWPPKLRLILQLPSANYSHPHVPVECLQISRRNSATVQGSTPGDEGFLFLFPFNSF